MDLDPFFGRHSHVALKCWLEITSMMFLPVPREKRKNKQATQNLKISLISLFSLATTLNLYWDKN